MTEQKLNVYQAIIEVRKRVKGVAEKGWNKSQSYKYRMAKDVIAAIREAMNEVGLSVFPKGLQDIQIMKGDKGTTATITGNMDFVLVAADGSKEAVQVPCSGWDATDKHTYKALTGATKYLFFTLFLLETGENDPDDDHQAPKPEATVQKPQNGKSANNGKLYENGLKELTQEAFSEWGGGKIYGLRTKDPYIFINNEKYRVAKSQIGFVKNDNRYVASS